MAYVEKGSPDELAKPILGEDSDGTFDFIRRDTHNNAGVSISHGHSLLHEGRRFMAHYYDAALINTASVEIIISVPAATYPHLVSTITVSGDCSIEFYEGATTTADGTAINLFNRNRNSATTPDIVLTHTPTISGDGTIVHPDYIPGGQKKKATGGEDGFDDELVLKPSTKYLLRVTNESGANAIVAIAFDWYE